MGFTRDFVVAARGTSPRTWQFDSRSRYQFGRCCDTWTQQRHVRQHRVGLNFRKEQQELLTHFFRRLITFSLKRLEVQISAEWPFWISDDLQRLKVLACPGVDTPAAASRSEFQPDLEGHLKVLLRQGDFVLETTLGKDGIKLFGGKHTPATSLMPGWGELRRQSSALIQKGHHTSPALG